MRGALRRSRSLGASTQSTKASMETQSRADSQAKEKATVVRRFSFLPSRLQRRQRNLAIHSLLVSDFALIAICVFGGDGDASETCTPRSRTRVARTEETTTSQCRDYRVGRTVSFIPLAPADRRHIRKRTACPARGARTVVPSPSGLPQRLTQRPRANRSKRGAYDQRRGTKRRVTTDTQRERQNMQQSNVKFKMKWSLRRARCTHSHRYCGHQQRDYGLRLLCAGGGRNE